MKKYVLVFAAVLAVLAGAVPLAAFSGEAMPEEVYSALVSRPATAQKQGPAKGKIAVLISHESCKPCSRLEAALTDNSQGGTSVLDVWREKGVSFYYIRLLEDKKHAAPSFVSVWKVQNVPTVLFFKDGILENRLNGFSLATAEETLAKMRQWAASAAN